MNFTNTGVAVNLTHIQIGTGNYTATGSETALQAPVAAQSIAGAIANPNGFTVSAIFAPPSSGSYTVGEIGFWSGSPGASGSFLFAVYAAPTPFAWRTPDTGDWTPSFALAFTDVPTGSVNITTDPGQSAAIAAMYAIMNVHNNDPQAHPNWAVVPIVLVSTMAVGEVALPGKLYVFDGAGAAQTLTLATSGTPGECVKVANMTSRTDHQLSYPAGTTINNKASPMTFEFPVDLAASMLTFRRITATLWMDD